MLPNTVSTMASAAFFVRPATWATSSTSAAFVNVPSVTGRSLSPAGRGSGARRGRSLARRQPAPR